MDRQAALANLRATGFCFVDPIEGAAFAELRDYLLSRPVFLDAHIPETARRRGHHPIPRMIASSECICLDLPDVIVAPHLIEKAIEVSNIAGTYLNLDPPVGYSMNAFWTRPGPGAARGDIQDFHCDKDDVRFLVMFVYLTDVLNDEQGPHNLEGPDGVRRTIFGPAGTVFLADTSRPHRGRKPAAGERGIAWFRWGVSPLPPAYEWDRNAPIAAATLGSRFPTDPDLRRSIALLAN